MKLIGIVLTWLSMFFSAFAAVAQDTQYHNELDILFKSFQKKDYALMKPLLDSDVKVGPLPRGYNDAVMPQVLNQLPVPESYTVINTEKKAAGTLVNTEYHYAGGLVRKQNFLFDVKGKIADMDILSDAQTSAMTMTPGSPTDLPDRFEAPFELHGHIIFIKANLNGKEESFIMDSGAPLLILNKRYFSSDSLPGAVAKGVGGDVEMGKTHVQSFDWHGLGMKDFDAITLSLSHVERECHRHFIGLIGYDVFKDYEVTFDYKNKVASFIKTDDDGKPVQPVHQSAPICTVPLEMSAHIAVIPVTMSGKTYKMGIDCGASSNLLYAKYLPALDGNLKRKHKRRLGGAGADVTRVVYTKVKTATVGTATYKDMTFAFDDNNLQEINNGYSMNIDGLVGYDFLKQYKTTINYKKKEVRIYAE